MKLISFVVPCYNSEDYMEKCIDSLLIGKDEVEIIIVNDGSTDKTGSIADRYQKKYPDIIKVIHKENGGHGSGINAGLSIAKGKYFKVVDSDDWVDKSAYKKILKIVKNCESDLIVTNYVYTYENKENQVISFENVFPSESVLTWDDTKRFKRTQYLSLHSMMYKKSILDKTNMVLPEHVFYEDNLFIYWPLPYVKTIRYINVNFYQYFIGRAGQSVAMDSMIKRSHHQVLVTEEAVSKHDLENIENKKLKKVMKRELILLCTLGVVFSRMSETEEGEKQYKEMWLNIKNSNPNVYRKIRHTSLATLVSFRGTIGRKIALIGYKLAHKLVGFN